MTGTRNRSDSRSARNRSAISDADPAARGVTIFIDREGKVSCASPGAQARPAAAIDPTNDRTTMSLMRGMANMRLLILPWARLVLAGVIRSIDPDRCPI
jgi:hypothetical protein